MGGVLGWANAHSVSPSSSRMASPSRYSSRRPGSSRSPLQSTCSGRSKIIHLGYIEHMNKTVKFAVATAVALVLGSSVALADDAPSGKPQVTIAAGKNLQAAQKALSSRNYEEVLSSLEKVKSDPKKNEYDTHLMNEFYLSAYAGMKKNAEAEG